MNTRLGSSGGAVALWWHALGNVRERWPGVLSIHVAFTLLGLAVFTPLVGLAARALIAFSGEPALADQDIAAFVLSPTGLLALVVFAALLIGILAFEQSAMMHLTRHPAGRTSEAVADALAFTAARFPSVLLFAGHLVVRVLTIVLPFLGIAAAIAWLQLGDYDINYYLAERPAEFRNAVIAIAAVLAVMVFVVGRKLLHWWMALPLVLFARVTPGASFAASRRRLAGRRLDVLVALALWAGLSLALGAALLGSVRGVGGWWLSAVPESLWPIVLSLTALGFLLAVGNLFAGAIATGHFAAIMADWHRRVAGGDGDFASRDVERQALAFRLTPVRVMAGLALAAGIAVFAGSLLLLDIRTRDDVAVIGHRGAAAHAPENTLAAIRAGIEQGADWIEVDVQETADGAVVVVHDSDFMKVAGVPAKVWQKSLEEVQAIDVGSRFAQRFAAERVPTLEQALDAVRGRARLVIELKYYGHDERLEERVAEIVEARGMKDEVALMSLQYRGVRKMKSLRPGWSVGLLSATALGNLSRLDTDFLAVSTRLATAGFMRRARRAGKPVYVWTVNDPVTASRMISRGADGLITDEPAMVRQVIADRAEMSTVQRLLLNAAPLFGERFDGGEAGAAAP